MPRTPHLLALLLTAPALVGCVAEVQTAAAPVEGGSPLSVADVVSKLSQKLGDLPILHSVVDVETRHGLANVDLYLPEMPNGEKVPVVLVASPYNNEHGALNLQGGGKRGEDNWIDLRLYNWMREELLPRGYALAQMDILGTRNSGGCQGIMNAAERQSTADVVEWLAAQQWSTGKVGMVGKSYLGMSQLGAAVEAPEHLAAIVPISPPTHDYGYHYYNGVPYLYNHATNAAYYGAFGLPPPDGDPATYGPRYVERFPCAPEALAASFYTMGDYSERWQERDYRPLLQNMRSDLAVFFIAGHQDWNVKPDHPLDVFNAIPGPKMGLFGQWAHDYPNINNWDEGEFGEREDWYYTLHRWFDHHLKGIDTGLMREAAACPVQTQGSDAKWRCADAFPPTDAAWTTVFPQADGSLAAEPGSGEMTFRDGDVGGTSGARPSTQAELAWSMPVGNATRILGAPEVALRVATTSPYNAHLVAALAVRNGSDLREFTWGFQSLRHRASQEEGEPVVPGEAYEVRFRLYPVDHVLEPGQELVLLVRGVNSAASQVQILPNPVPGLLTLTLGETTALSIPGAALDGEFRPLADADLPDAYPAEK